MIAYERQRPAVGRGMDKSRRAFYKPRHIALARAQVAQLVEHATENRSVGGSIPPLGTSLLSSPVFFHCPSYASVPYKFLIIRRISVTRRALAWFRIPLRFGMSEASDPLSAILQRPSMRDSEAWDREKGTQAARAARLTRQSTTGSDSWTMPRPVTRRCLSFLLRMHSSRGHFSIDAKAVDIPARMRVAPLISFT